MLCVERTRVYTVDNVPVLPSAAGDQPPFIAVWNGDCLLAAEKLLGLKYKRVVVLNMADANSPGGGYLSGHGAQEENVHRRSTYAAVLPDPFGMTGSPIRDFYPIGQTKAVYSPGVEVFRGEEKAGYPLLRKPFVVDMLAAAAVKSPRTADNRMDAASVNAMRRVIRLILQVAALHQADALVLSALGCGAYACPPRHVAELFKEEIDVPDQGNRFKTIVFAIFEDHNSNRGHNPDGNVGPFADVFGQKAVKLSSE